MMSSFAVRIKEYLYEAHPDYLIALQNPVIMQRKNLHKFLLTCIAPF